MRSRHVSLPPSAPSPTGRAKKIFFPPGGEKQKPFFFSHIDKKKKKPRSVNGGKISSAETKQFCSHIVNLTKYCHHGILAKEQRGKTPCRLLFTQPTSGGSSLRNRMSWTAFGECIFREKSLWQNKQSTGQRQCSMSGLSATPTRTTNFS